MEKDNLITELNSSENISINGGWIGFVAGFVLSTFLGEVLFNPSESIKFIKKRIEMHNNLN